MTQQSQPTTPPDREIPRALRELLDAVGVRVADRQRELDALLAETTMSGATDDDEHDPDGSPVSLQRTLAAALVDRATVDLAAAEAACRRVVAGTYGVCEGCGDAIPEARLEAAPTAVTCVGCGEERGQRRLPRS